ncbi:2'-hydroxyisoflavone reductase [Stackebrandtia endophytica]|uniref:2'-hydroxyisoflavone reductase n=1 Tax=Stackebrandtia endophytica TaxID=1496996 RepID=A0A543B0U3_9ACTN|nr:NAD-dependent epimerase/dehydratase family protein [Stackebrandtia endophytica]TQL78439.1 2'-hydroxyisoflavone reductase [Stackebrandtia endophytica]
MRLLVLGGTSFVGRTIVADALDHDWDVTLFGRGKTGTELFPQAKRLIGDRDTDDYRALSVGEWDAVVDVSGYVPRHVGGAMDALGDRVGRYLFISSHAVYQREGIGPGSTESTPLRPERRDTEELDESSYGPLKVACENDIVARFAERATIVRPGRVAGPHDNQDAFTYWVRRAAQGGRLALPADPDQPTQITDSRDLARLVIRLLADERPGAFNAIGPGEPTTLSGLIRTCAEAAGTDVDIVPIPAETAPFLFPLVRERSGWSSLQRDPAKARAAGMPATPLSVTAADVLAWDRERGLPPLDRGFSAEEEARLLELHG